MELRMDDGSIAGTAAVQRQGTDTVFTVSARLPQGLWRIVARGSAGELALGVVEGGACTLHRRFSHALADRLGAVESVTAHAAGARMESEWQACRRGTAPHLPPGALWRPAGEGRALALPWTDNAPFPRPEWFCLARVGTMAGRTWVFYTLDREGTPVLAQENGVFSVIPSTISCGDVV